MLKKFLYIYIIYLPPVIIHISYSLLTFRLAREIQLNSQNEFSRDILACHAFFIYSFIS